MSLPLSVNGLFYFFDDGFERIGVVQGQVGQYLTVQLDTGFLQTSHQHRVGHTVSPATGADTDDPQGAEIALFLLTVAVSINQTFFDGVFGYRPHIFPRAIVTFGQFEDLFATRARSNCIYRS